jgi:hypothetical protein
MKAPRILLIAALLLALLASVGRAENSCVQLSCAPGSGVAVLTTATNVCSLPTYAAAQFGAGGAYSYFVIAAVNYTEPATATTIATSNGSSTSGAVTGVASSGIQAVAISSGIWTPATSSAYPASIGTMTATAGTTGGTANTSSSYTFFTCPMNHQ